MLYLCVKIVFGDIKGPKTNLKQKTQKISRLLLFELLELK